MNNGVRAALELSAENLVIVGDSRLAIQQYLGVIACRKKTRMAKLNYHKELTSKLKSVKYLHILRREFNAAADSLATEALESKTSKVVLDESRKPELTGLNRIREVIYDSSQTRIEVKPVAEDSTRRISTILASQRIQLERRLRIAIVQDEELKWINLKTVYLETPTSSNIELPEMQRFLLTDDNVLYYMNPTPRNQQTNQQELRLRLVVPTTMIQEVLQNNHDSLEGGHQGVVRTYQRVKQDYYWFGLYADVEKHVKSCPDCSSSKSKPQLRGYSPGNILAERPFQIVSMDFVIPLLKSRQGNTALLLF
ncbi:reverse transcriptase [Phytophthora megakarya]|uniref:Reverse transcriptase n=1 Tax=Phytophthora megakarya TaxID=4795 RepID=A0A225USA4_9STRA|nr:reverse transcriptase [Phytophthora megakarya]